jgi:hypothetical protein
VSDAFAQSEGDVDRFVDALELPPGAVGAVFSLNGHPVGFELYESAALCTSLSAKLIRSWALDAIEFSQASDSYSRLTDGQVADFIRSITTAPSKRFHVVGLGENVRFLDDDVAGGALVLGDRVLHFVAFSLAFDGWRDK